MLLIKLISILLILLSTVFAGFFPFFSKIKNPEKTEFPLGEALASGIFLGAGMIHMLGDASHDFHEQGYHYPYAFLLSGAMFLLLLFFEHVGRELHQHNGAENKGFIHLTVIMLSIHSFLEGAALGLSVSYSLMVLIIVAILAHKWAAAFALAVQINKSKLSLFKGLQLFTIFALMTPIGILSGTFVTSHIDAYPLLEPIFISIASGTFLYLGTLHGLKKAVMIEKCCDLRHFMFVVLGFFVMAVIGIWA